MEYHTRLTLHAHTLYRMLMLGGILGVQSRRLPTMTSVTLSTSLIDEMIAIFSAFPYDYYLVTIDTIVLLTL